MAKFTDRLKREWTVEILVIHLPILRTEFGIDTKSNDWPEKLATLINSNDEEFVRLLGVLCDEQVKAVDLKPADFIAGFNVETLIASAAAVEDAITDFFLRSSKTRTVAKAKQAALHDRLDTKRAALLEMKADGLIENVLSKIDEASKNSVGGSAASSASIPTA